ncbi:hypothetical protein R1flu_025734 [Riccia fluitans]|uniref:Uncharacterized protein n=1 Tax=Riccia fluitans TaxID=41844 RepID=A0ABD1XYL0_9MARC
MAASTMLFFWALQAPVSLANIQSDSQIYCLHRRVISSFGLRGLQSPDDEDPQIMLLLAISSLYFQSTEINLRKKLLGDHNPGEKFEKKSWLTESAFSNPGKEAISEAAYSFPIYEAAAIVEFTCKIDGRTIQGVVRDKHKARKIYETAKEEGQQAALMVYNSPDVWSTKISNIPALGKVEVEVTVISELKHDAQVDGIRFTLPTKIAPRYGQEPENLPSGISPDSRGIDITCAVTTTSPITSLQSPSHPISVGMGIHNTKGGSSGEFDPCKGYATLSQKDTALDKDFVLLIVSAGSGEPQAILETHPTIQNSRALLLSLVPKFNLPRIKPEIIFIADRSGSMEPQIPQLKIALTVFLKSLPVGVKFNICSFGSDYKFLWPKSRPYDQDNLNAALKHVESFDAELGGTEMFPPIEAAFKERFQDLETEILVLTDGEIWDTEPLFKLVREQCESGAVRLFSLGIGDDVSHSLVEGLARAGRGYAQIVGNQDKLDVKVVQMLKAALGTHVKDYRLVFPDQAPKESSGDGFEFVEKEESSKVELDKSGTSDAKLKTISVFDPTADTRPRIPSEERFSHLPAFEPPSRLQTPYQIPPLYTFSRTNVYAFLSDSEPSPRSVVLRGTTTSGQTLELEIPVKDVGQGITVHQLAAKKLLKELEEGGSYLHSGEFGADPKDEGEFADWVEREGVRVGTTFGLAGKWTSFVAVENVAHLEQQLQEQEFEVEAEPEMLRSAHQRILFCCASVPVVNYHFAKTSLAPRVSVMEESYVSVDEDYLSGGIAVPDGLAPTPASMDTADFQEDLEKVTADEEDFQEGFTYFDDTNADTHQAFLEYEGDDVAKKTFTLVKMQEFDGSFPKGSGEYAQSLTASFKTWISQQHEEWGAALRSSNEDLLSKLLSSAVAVAIFSKDLNESKDLWEMVVEKAEDWGLETVGQKAWSSLKTWVGQQLASASSSDKASFWVPEREVTAAAETLD